MATAQPIPYRRIYVWEVPVRLFHWINVVCIVLLAATGYLIGNPQAIFSANEPYEQYWFGWVRFTHFAAAYIFFFNFLFRIYWAFAGNQFSNWRNYVPYRKQQFVELWKTIRVDIVQLDLRGKVHVGHNYLASFTYFGLCFVIIFMVVTGFGLYSSMSESYIPWLFTWIIPLMGGDANVRNWHHLFMWAFVIFTIIHMYLVFYHDYVEGRGTTSSIIDGWKFIREDEIKDE
jgi:Ni/Fe-hydrogenase 1 B-type cytochrome subunit